jgi:hypothetical protein
MCKDCQSGYHACFVCDEVMIYLFFISHHGFLR